MQVSVIVNTYNRAGSLGDLLSSLRYQTYEAFEVVVVAGPCTDETPQLLDRWGDAVRVVECPELHLSISRNVGIDAASGEIVAFIDDDAVPSAHWLEGLVAAYDSDSVAGAGGIVYDNDGFTIQYEYSVCDRSAETRFDVRPPLDRYVHPGADPFLYLQGTNCSFRRDRLEEIGGFDEEIEYFLDEVDVCLELVDRGYQLRALPGASVQHRYLQSHIRDDRGVVSDPYAAAKNRLMFALRHGRGRHPVHEILARHVAYLDSLRAVADHEHAEGRIDDQRRDWFSTRVEEATRSGMELGLSGERRGRAIAAREAGAFRPFPTLRPPGGSLRICFTSVEYPPDVGGIGRWTADLAQGLAADGHEVHVLTSATDAPAVRFEDGCWVHRLAYADLKIPDLEGVPVEGLLYRLAIVHREMQRLSREAPIDLVSGGLWGSEGYLAQLEPDRAGVLTLHTSYEKIASMHPSWDGLPHTRQMIALEHATLARARFVIANSEGSLDEARDLVDPRTLEASWVVPHGVRDRRAEVVRRRPDDGRVRLLFAGRLERRKGIDVLLGVAPDLLHEFPELEIVLVGRDTANTELGTTYRRAFERGHGSDSAVRNRVLFAGEISDDELAQSYADADLFCAPSRFESFGLTLVEAMSFGLPVVGCWAGGMTDIVVDGATGFLVEPGDPESLGEALRKLVGDTALRARMGEEARRRFEELYDLPIAVARTVAVYREAVAQVGEDRETRKSPDTLLTDDLQRVVSLDSRAARRVAKELLGGWPTEAAVRSALSRRQALRRRAPGQPLAPAIGSALPQGLREMRNRPAVGRLLRYVKRFVLAPWNIQRIWDSVRALGAATEVQQEQLNQVERKQLNVGERVDTALERVDRVEPALSGLSERVDVMRRKLELLALDVRESDSSDGGQREIPEPRILDPAGYEAKTAAMAGGLRVNLGSGEKPLDDHLNVDMREAEGVDVLADVRRLPFSPGSVGELASYHLVEHFREHQLATVILPYWRSLLGADGLIRIVCPNWEVMLERVTSRTMSYEDFKTVTFGLQDYDGDDHFAMYTPDSLRRILAEAGFRDIELVVADRQNGSCPEMELLARAPGDDQTEAAPA